TGPCCRRWRRFLRAMILFWRGQAQGSFPAGRLAPGASAPLLPRRPCFLLDGLDLNGRDDGLLVTGEIPVRFPDPFQPVLGDVVVDPPQVAAMYRDSPFLRLVELEDEPGIARVIFLLERFAN